MPLCTRRLERCDTSKGIATCVGQVRVEIFPTHHKQTLFHQERVHSPARVLGESHPNLPSTQATWLTEQTPPPLLHSLSTFSASFTLLGGVGRLRHGVVQHGGVQRVEAGGDGEGVRARVRRQDQRAPPHVRHASRLTPAGPVEHLRAATNTAVSGVSLIDPAGGLVDSESSRV